MRSLLTILTLLVSGLNFAQDNYCNAMVDKNFIGQNERFKYEITTNLDCEIVIPDFESVGLKIVSGPMQGTSSSYTNVNGRAKMITEHSLAYYLVATEKGNFIIPPAKVECANKEFVSEGVKITVGEGSAAGQPDQNQGHFLMAIPNKTSVYEGEAYTVTLKFYTKNRPTGINGVQIGTNTPMFRDNLYKEKASYNFEQETVKGERYYVVEMYKDVCIPLSASPAEINPYYAALSFGGIFNEKYQEAYSNKVDNVTVKALPQPKPENFNGLVGQFEMIHSIDKTTLNVGQVIDLKITINGTGNFNTFDDPELNFPDAFHIFDPEVERNLTLTENGFTGSVEYHYVISPDEKGDFILPAYSFSYFDPNEKRYKSLTTEEFNIKVKEGEHPYLDDEGIRKDPTQDDIHYIHGENFSYFNPGDFLFGTIAFWIMLLLPLFVSGVLIRIQVRNKNKTSDEIIQSKQKEAKKTIIKDFNAAKKLMKEGKSTEALKSFQQSMINYFMIKLNLSLSSLSKQAISTELQHKNIQSDLIEAFKKIWDEIEMAQYTPEGTHDLNRVIGDMEKLIRELNKTL